MKMRYFCSNKRACSFAKNSRLIDTFDSSPECPECGTALKDGIPAPNPVFRLLADSRVQVGLGVVLMSGLLGGFFFRSHPPAMRLSADKFEFVLEDIAKDADMDLEIRNDGKGPLRFETIRFSQGADLFDLSGLSSGGSLAGSQSSVLKIIAKDGVKDGSNATLELLSNDPLQPRAVIQVRVRSEDLRQFIRDLPVPDKP